MGRKIPPLHSHTHTARISLSLPVSRGEEGAMLALQTDGPMAFFARNGLQMAQFPWSEPIEKPPKEEEEGSLP